jgi:NAD(P)-dependent dehydrogenase (short-subunit alcohol dehydrogenase family)
LLITGGSRGLGKALVAQYANEGFTVYEFSRSGDSDHHIYCDFNSPIDSARMIEDMLSRLSKKNYSEILLINNAGTIHPIGPISGFEVDAWIENMNINLNSAVIASGMFIKYFQNHAAKKVIGSISSGAAIRAKQGWSLYCGAKAGLDHFCRALALEQHTQEHPIDVVLIDPGVMDTDMQAKIRSADESLFPELQRFVNMKEDGQLLKPEFVAQKIYDILSGEVANGDKYSVE